MKKINIYIWVLLFGVLSCSDELEKVNIDPNSPSSVPLESIFLGVQRDLSHDFVELTFDITNKFVNYAENPGGRSWDFFLIDRDDEKVYWDRHFAELRNINFILENAKEGQENYKGVALVIKSWMYYHLTSLYGDVPFTEGGQGNNDVNQPKFDSQQTVFEGILADLTEANTILGTGTSPLNGDFLLGNDISKWKKFANSLRLRVLIAQSKKVDPSSALQTIVSNPETYPLMESNADQPAFSYNNEINYPRNFNTDYTKTHYLVEDLIDTLNDFGDDRVKAFAALDNNNEYSGVAAGEQLEPLSGTYSGPSDFYYNTNIFVAQAVWMSYAEVQFLLAEAAEKGWISGGTDAAKAYYANGIKASYTYYFNKISEAVGLGVNVPLMSPWSDGYLSTAGVAYTGTTAEKNALIQLQKWIALYNDFEGYYSWRRTGLPVLTMNPSGANGGIAPKRFRYPENERIFNTDNYNSAVSAMGGDEWSTLMWILQ